MIFTADHGTAAGFDPATGAGYNAGLRGKKGSLYDGGHQVSFFMRWLSHLPAERKVSQLTAHIDILPTLIDICELKQAPAVEFDGISLAGLVGGDAANLPARSIIVQLQPDQPQKWHQCAVLNGRWRLVNGAELYDVEGDRGQEYDIAAEQPRALQALRQDYEAFWHDMRDCFAQTIAIPVGTAYENPALLSARDWHPTCGRVPWQQSWIEDRAFDAQGYWLIKVAHSGPYQFELRTHPREADQPMGSTSASLQLGELRRSKIVAKDDSYVSFEVDLRAGLTRLSASISEPSQGRSRGAYYIYVTKLWDRLEQGE